MEHDVILKVLQANHWNRRKAAEVLKISYRALLYKVRQAGLPAKRPRRKPEAEPASIARAVFLRRIRSFQDFGPTSCVVQSLGKSVGYVVLVSGRQSLA